MTSSTELLMVGTLFGKPNEQIAERFKVYGVPDFTVPVASTGIDTSTLRAVAVGMVGTGHIPGVPVDGAFLDQFPALEIVAGLGVGHDHIDVAAAARRNITVTNTPNVNSEEVADTAMGLLLATVRRLPQADRFVRTGQWANAMFPLTATLRNKCLGILGLGSIGKAVARRASGFGVKIAYHGRNRQSDVGYEYYDSPLSLAAAADVLMVIVPGGAETRKMVNAEVLRALGPDGFLINISRGTVVDEDALVRALQAGTIAGAGLDAFEHEPDVPEPLLAMDSVVLTPHVGSGTHHTREVMSQSVIDNLFSWVEGKPVPNRVA